MKITIIIIIIIILFSLFTKSESNAKQDIFQKKTILLKQTKTNSKDIFISDSCIEYDLKDKLKRIKRAKLITFKENDFKSNFDSINNETNYILNIFLDSLNNIETFQLLSKLKNPLGIRLNLDVSRQNRDGINLLNNIEYLEIHGATASHLNQLKDLSTLKMLHLAYASIDSFPLIFDSNLNLRYLNLILCKIKNVPSSFTNQACLEELNIIKSAISNLPLDNNLKKLKKLYTYRVRRLKLPRNLDSINSLKFITLDKNLTKQMKNFKLLNFDKQPESNYESITYKIKNLR